MVLEFGVWRGFWSWVYRFLCSLASLDVNLGFFIFIFSCFVAERIQVKEKENVLAIVLI